MGHGHVIPNKDGSLARCGGPTICPDCALELVGQRKTQTKSPVELAIEECEWCEEMDKAAHRIYTPKRFRCALKIALEALEIYNQDDTPDYNKFAREAIAKINAIFGV